MQLKYCFIIKLAKCSFSCLHYNVIFKKEKHITQILKPQDNVWLIQNDVNKNHITFDSVIPKFYDNKDSRQWQALIRNIFAVSWYLSQWHCSFSLLYRFLLWFCNAFVLVLRLLIGFLFFFFIENRSLCFDVSQEAFSFPKQY